jgi:hypothetical protein
LPAGIGFAVGCSPSVDGTDIDWCANACAAATPDPPEVWVAAAFVVVALPVSAELLVEPLFELPPQPAATTATATATSARATRKRRG